MALRIKEIIKAKGLDVKTVAEKMGITRVTLSTHINGNPSAQILERIADAVGCNVGDFFTDGATPTPPSPVTSIICPHCNKQITIKVEE